VASQEHFKKKQSKSNIPNVIHQRSNVGAYLISILVEDKRPEEEIDC
jgi:hypothetical protein